MGSRCVSAVALTILAACFVLAAEQAAPVRPATEAEALALAATDLLTLAPEDRLYTRYVWITTAEPEELQAVALTLNYVSRGTVAIRPLPVGKDKLMLARVDLRSYAPREKDLAEMSKLWEEFRFDPRFNLLITRDTLKFTTGVDLPTTKRTVKRKVQQKDKEGRLLYFDGDKNKPAMIEEEEVVTERGGFDADTDVLRVVSEHLDKATVATLIQGTQSQAPVVNHRYFMTRALSTIQGKGIFKTIYGGLYYDLVGIKRGAKRGTDEDVFLEQLGVGNVEKGVTAKKIFDELRSDQRAAIFRSKVTGKPRRTDLLRTLAGRDSQGIVSITHDLKDDQIDIGQHPMMNLLDFQDAAREVIAEKTNGLHLFALFDGKGVLQDEVPPDIAVDHTIPSPHTARLQPAISCIRCHADNGGWKAVENDVTKLLSGYLDVFGEAMERKKSVPDVVDRLAGLYAGNLEQKTLPRARDDYAAGILRSTGPWKRSKSQTDLVKVSADRIAATYNGYVYDLVDAQKALADLGVVVEKKAAPETLKKLLPPVPQVVDGYLPEDARLAALMMGLSIPRSDWDLVYSFAATRAAKRGKP